MDKITKIEKPLTENLPTDINHDGKISTLEAALSDARDTLNTTLAFVTSALTLAASLAWNDLIITFFQKVLFVQFQTAGLIFGQALYALIITVIAVFAINKLKNLQSKIGGKSIK
ncbi:MAG: DUF5654 family protein [bacterium]